MVRRVFGSRADGCNGNGVCRKAARRQGRIRRVRRRRLLDLVSGRLRAVARQRPPGTSDRVRRRLPRVLGVVRRASACRLHEDRRPQGARNRGHSLGRRLPHHWERTYARRSLQPLRLPRRKVHDHGACLFAGAPARALPERTHHQDRLLVARGLARAGLRTRRHPRAAGGDAPNVRRTVETTGRLRPRDTGGGTGVRQDDPRQPPFRRLRARDIRFPEAARRVRQGEGAHRLRRVGAGGAVRGPERSRPVGDSRRRAGRDVPRPRGARLALRAGDSDGRCLGARGGDGRAAVSACARRFVPLLRPARQPHLGRLRAHARDYDARDLHRGREARPLDVERRRAPELPDELLSLRLAGPLQGLALLPARRRPRGDAHQPDHGLHVLLVHVGARVLPVHGRPALPRTGVRPHGLADGLHDRAPRRQRTPPATATATGYLSTGRRSRCTTPAA